MSNTSYLHKFETVTTESGLDIEVGAAYVYNNNLKVHLGTVSKSVNRPYKVYTALVTQTGTDAPVVTVLENEVGTISWARTSAGLYTGTLAGAFLANKVVGFVQIADPTAATGSVSRATDNTVVIQTAKTADHTKDDALLNGASVEIRIYP